MKNQEAKSKIEERAPEFSPCEGPVPGVTFLIFVFCFLSFAFAAPPATDYEWELQVSNRTLFRNLTPIGRISLVHTAGQGGILGKKGKETGESMLVQTDVSFDPGDTTRYFALNVSLFDGDQELVSAVVDLDEIADLHGAMKYMLETAGHILDTDRPDTRIQRRTKSGLLAMFQQRSTHQHFEISFPAENDDDLVRVLYPEQFSSLRDLIELAMFDLRRQGAQFESVVESSR